MELTNKRDVLTQVKHERDALRGDNASRRQQRGLVSAEELLVDFEKRRLDIVAKNELVAAQKRKHELLLSSTAQLKRAIVAAGGTA